MGAGRAVAVAARRDGGELAGVIPLALDRPRRPRSARFAGAALGDVFGLAARPEDESEVGAAAIAALEREAALPVMTILHRIERSGTWPAEMAAAAHSRLATVEQSRSELPHVTIAGLDWDGYLAGRTKKFRQRVARGLERALERQGIGFAVRQTEEAGSLAADLDTVFELHDLRRHGRGSSISAPSARSFLREFSAAALERGWLRLRILELEGRPAAAYLSWRVGPRYSVYQGGFDPAFAKHSVGMLLLNDIIRSAISEEAEEVDLGHGDEAYKWRFAPEARGVHTVVMVRALRPARLVVAGEAAARRRGRALGRRPVVGRIAHALARLLPTGRPG